MNRILFVCGRYEGIDERAYALADETVSVGDYVLTGGELAALAVTGVPDPDRGQAVKATIVLAQGYAPSAGLTKELQTHVKKVTAPYKYPRVIAYVPELPKTISGKIKRAEIRAKDRG